MKRWCSMVLASTLICGCGPANVEVPRANQEPGAAVSREVGPFDIAYERYVDGVPTGEGIFLNTDQSVAVPGYRSSDKYINGAAMEVQRCIGSGRCFGGVAGLKPIILDLNEVGSLNIGGVAYSSSKRREKGAMCETIETKSLGQVVQKAVYCDGVGVISITPLGASSIQYRLKSMRGLLGPPSQVQTVD